MCALCGRYYIICQYSLDFIHTNIYTKIERPFHFTWHSNTKHRLSTFIVYSVISFILFHHYRTYFILFYSTLLNILYSICIQFVRCAYSATATIYRAVLFAMLYVCIPIWCHSIWNCEIDGRIINIKANKQKTREHGRTSTSLINAILEEAECEVFSIGSYRKAWYLSCLDMCI